ncbi:MAG TPA: hypothetical protein VN711_02215, partial [Candidatus Saccharimonadales bacterium]|nr:hypothetical protein [Candidatus Saccharimonadales bacterium]
MAKTEKAGGKGKKDKKGRKEEVSPKSVEDIAAPLGYSMEARLRVLSGTKSALMGVDQLPEKTSVLSFVQANPEGLSNVYAGVQTAWNHERENVSLTREQWGVNAAKATLRLLRNHRENPEELALLQTAFQGWGVDIDTNILGDMSKIAEQLPRVAASFSGQFYDAYCGEGQAKGVRALEEGLVQAMDQSYITSFGKYGKHTERFYIDPQGQMESSQNIRSSLTLLDPFLARYFGNEDLYTAFQVSLAANLTARAASFYPSEIAVSPITDSEKQALALIAAHIPESTGARRDVPATV